MLALDLRWVILALFLLLCAAIGITLWLDRFYLERKLREPPLFGRALEPAFEYAPIGMVVLSAARCLGANSYARHLLQIDLAPCALPHAEWVDLLQQDRQAARKDPNPTGRMRRIPIHARAVQWWIIPSAELDFVFVSDVTHAEEAEQAARILINDLAHELRTPLATILTHLRVLQLNNVSQETHQQSIQFAALEGKRMARLLHDLLELGRLETTAALELRPLELRGLIDEVVAQLAAQADARNIRLEAQVALNLPLVMGDADRLRQVFLNLVDNAIKYCRPDDNVLVTAEYASAQDIVICQVSDTGPGISSEHLPHLKRRFYRVAQEEVEGSGLGLAMAQEILRHHSSELEITSVSGGDKTGTCFRFTLPTVRELEKEE